MREGLRKRLRPDDRRLALVEHAEAGVEPGLEGVRVEEPVAETVDGRDPGALDFTGQVVALQLDEALPDPGLQLAGGPFGVGDHDDRVDREPPLTDRAYEPFDEDGRLPGARAGRDEDDARLLDRGELLRARTRHGRLTRHIVQYEHQDGQLPSRGS